MTNGPFVGTLFGVTYAIELEPRAVKELARIPEPDKARIIARLGAFGEDPRPVGVEKLQGQADAYRVRQGNYRIIYTVDDGLKILTVTKIGQRGSVYR